MYLEGLDDDPDFWNMSVDEEEDISPKDEIKSSTLMTYLACGGFRTWFTFDTRKSFNQGYDVQGQSYETPSIAPASKTRFSQ